MRGKEPLELVFKKRIGNKSLALKVECRVKKLTKIKKEMLADGKIRISKIKQEIISGTK